MKKAPIPRMPRTTLRKTDCSIRPGTMDGLKIRPNFFARRMHGMEIIRKRHDGDEAEVKVRGRLDAYWVDHAAAELDELVRAGAHRLWVDCSEVTYLSSLGIGLLLRLQKELKGLGGAFKIHSPSEPVREVLNLAKLLPLLVGPPPEQGGRITGTWEGRAPRRAQMHERNGVAYETFVYEGKHCLGCRALGNPSLLDGGR